MDRSHSSETWPADRARTYANHLDTLFDVSNIELCFSQRFGLGNATTPQCWIVTTPVHLLGFNRAIRQTLDSYSVRYGRVPDDNDGTGPWPA